MDKNNKRNFDWRQFIISVLGTSIGVALTFVINGMVERRNKEQAQRLTAIMVIYDIDNTIDILKYWKEKEEEAQKLFLYVQEHKDQEAPIPTDTLDIVLNLLVKDNTNYQFDTSKEKIFSSDVDIWQNLENMKFIDNVQDIFNVRQELVESANSTEWFSKPIPAEEYMQIVMGGWTTQDLYNSRRWSFLKGKMQEKQVAYYINTASYRVSTLSTLVDKFTRLNDENKFIMGITDKEMDGYVNSISYNGHPLTRARLMGQWSFLSKDQMLDYDFHSDNSYTATNTLTSDFKRALYWSGTYKVRCIYSGTWSIQEDSLIMTPAFDAVDVQVDLSDIEVKDNMQDSLSAWMNKVRDMYLEHFRSLQNEDNRQAFKARLDSSRDKMELTDEKGSVRYLKRD